MKRFSLLLAALLCALPLHGQITLPVNTALGEILINAVALTDDGDFKTREESVVFNQAGLDLVWNFTTKTGAHTQTAVTPTDTAGNYDFINQGNGFYTIEIPASGGASINNNTEGCGFFAGFATGILPWVGPTYCFVQVDYPEVIAHGTAQSATGTTIVLAAASAFADDELNGNLITIIGGTGKGQTRQIDDYVSSTDTATVTTWTTNPDSTSVYQITPMLVLQSAADVGTEVWATATRTITGTGTGAITSASFAAAAIDAAAIAAGAITSSEAPNLDAAVSSRMATYTQPTGFLAATFPTTVASTTNITAGTLTTVTNATNISAGGITNASFANDAITAAKVAADVATELQTGLRILKKNTATATDRIKFFAFDTSGNVTKTASGVTCQISVDNAAPTTVTDAPTEVEFTTGAYWKFGLTQAETNGDAAMIMCTGTGLADTALSIEFQN